MEIAKKARSNPQVTAPGQIGRSTQQWPFLECRRNVDCSTGIPRISRKYSNKETLEVHMLSRLPGANNKTEQWADWMAQTLQTQWDTSDVQVVRYGHFFPGRRHHHLLDRCWLLPGPNWIRDYPGRFFTGLFINEEKYPTTFEGFWKRGKQIESMSFWGEWQFFFIRIFPRITAFSHITESISGWTGKNRIRG